MDLRRLAHLVLLLLASSSSFITFIGGNVVFPVHHKFKGRERSLSALKAHDVRRHSRILFDVDLELGGNGQPSETGLVSFVSCACFESFCIQLLCFFIFALRSLGFFIPFYKDQKKLLVLSSTILGDANFSGDWCFSQCCYVVFSSPLASILLSCLCKIPLGIESGLSFFLT